MTLEQWQQLSGIESTMVPGTEHVSDLVVITIEYNHPMRANLWSLLDYKVLSVWGLTVILQPLNQ